MKREMNGKIAMIVTAAMLCFTGCGMESPVQEESTIGSEKPTEMEKMEESTAKDLGQNMGAESEESEEITGTGIDLSNLEMERIQAYRAVLTDICRHQTFPGDRDLGYDGFPMSDNRFALGDIDGDGSVELIVIYITTSTSGHAEIIYDYDASTDSVREQFIEYPAVVHFDNGILKADASHNHTLSGKIWPYTLYQYNAKSDSYDVIAQVEAWDKEIRDTDYEGNAFPDDVDADGDQTVYYIMETAGYDRKDPVDGVEYEQWYESYRNGAGMITIPYMVLTEENISKLK